MKHARSVTVLIGVLTALSLVPPVLAGCSTGRREMAVQHSDIRLEPGAQAYLPIQLFTVDLPFPAGRFPGDCGVYAKSELPGLSIVSGYGIVPPVMNPPGVWTQVGGASGAVATSQPWFGTSGGTESYFPFCSTESLRHERRGAFS